MNTDYYGFARRIKNLAEDLQSNTVGVSIVDITATLAEASTIITHLADEANHYRLRSSIIVIINGEEVELPEDVVDAFYREAANSWVTDAFRTYINQVVPDYRFVKDPSVDI